MSVFNNDAIHNLIVENQRQSDALKQKIRDMQSETVALAASSAGETNSYEVLKHKRESEKHKRLYETTLMKERDTLLAWVGSQNGYKDLAMKFGAELGYSTSQIAKMSKQRSIEYINEEAKKYKETTKNPSNYDIYNPGRVERVLPRFDPMPDYDEFVTSGRLYHFPDLNPESWEQAFELWMALAESGDAKAQFNIGRCFNRGDGVEKNPEKSLEWYKKSFEQNDPLAAFNLYLIYSDKDSKYYDVQIAKHYAKAALERGAPRAIPHCKEFIRNQVESELRNTPTTVNICETNSESRSAFDTAEEGLDCFLPLKTFQACKVETQTLNIRDVGGMFNKDVRGDCYLKITNPTDQDLSIKIENVELDGWNKQLESSVVKSGSFAMLPLATMKQGAIIPDMELKLDGKYPVNFILQGALRA